MSSTSKCSQGKIFVGNNTIFRFQVVSHDYEEDTDGNVICGQVIDLSTATTLEIIFNRPTGVPLVATGTATAADPASGLADGADGRYQYQALDADLDEAGTWRRQGHVELADGSDYWTEIVSFNVYGRLATS